MYRSPEGSLVYTATLKGSYDHGRGQLEGLKVPDFAEAGRVLEGVWVDPSGERGRFALRLDEAGERFAAGETDAFTARKGRRERRRGGNIILEERQTGGQKS